jgi:hypothetical protein
MDTASLSFQIKATRLTPLPSGSYELTLMLTPCRRQGSGKPSSASETQDNEILAGDFSGAAEIKRK